MYTYTYTHTVVMVMDEVTQGAIVRRQREREIERGESRSLLGSILNQPTATLEYSAELEEEEEEFSSSSSSSSSSTER